MTEAEFSNLKVGQILYCNTSNLNSYIMVAKVREGLGYAAYDCVTLIDLTGTDLPGCHWFASAYTNYEIVT